MNTKSTTWGVGKAFVGVLLAIAQVGVLTGCMTKGKPFQAVQPVPPDKGVLYVYNDPAHRGPCEVLINDSAVGLLRGADYMAFLCSPGPLIVSTGWETNLNSIKVDMAPSAQSFVSVDTRVHMGLSMVTLGLAPGVVEIRPKAVPEGEALAQIKKLGHIQASRGLADELTGSVTPGTDLSKLKSFYVDSGEKSWETPPFIVAGLIKRGFTAKLGPAAELPAGTDCYVKMRERWFWDLGSYLLKLEVEFLNPQTKAVLASGVVRRADPQGRRGPRVMANEVLNAIFNGGRPPGVENIP